MRIEDTCFVINLSVCYTTDIQFLVGMWYATFVRLFTVTFGLEYN